MRHLTAAFSVVPAMIHSFMFMYQVGQNGTVHMELTTDVFYWTGIVAIIALAYLVFFSWAIFRNANYELFKKCVSLLAHDGRDLIFTQAALCHGSSLHGRLLHPLSSHTVNMVCLLWGTRHILVLMITLRDYFVATAVIYVTCYLYRFGRTIYNSGVALFAYVSILPSGPSQRLAHVRIPVPNRVSWKPGQHVFIRFWGLGFPHSFSSHPWTVSSVCNEEGERAMEFVMRVQKGITARLAELATGKVSFPVMVWVDGPYGEVPGGLDVYDDVLFLGGGSGTRSSIID
jgi:hypothetical protein